MSDGMLVLVGILALGVGAGFTMRWTRKNKKGMAPPDEVYPFF